MKKKVLYFDELDFQEKSLNLLKSKFDLIFYKILKKKDLNKLISIIVPMNKFYDKKFFSQFQNLRSVLSPTTGDIHIDLKYLKSKKIKLINLTNQKNKLKNITTTAELTIGHI